MNPVPTPAGWDDLLATKLAAAGLDDFKILPSYEAVWALAGPDTPRVSMGVSMNVPANASIESALGVFADALVEAVQRDGHVAAAATFEEVPADATRERQFHVNFGLALRPVLVLQ